MSVRNFSLAAVFTEDWPAGDADGSPTALPFSHSDLQRRYEIEDLLFHALKEDSFIVYYQPLFNVKSGTFTEAEALLRLRDPKGGFIPPDEFIPIAEQCGLITDIGCAVLDRAAGYAHSLLQAGMNLDSISVNVSVVQLVQKNAVDRLMDTIRKNDLSPHHILLEVTESTIISNYKLIAEKIQQMSDAGVQFALDDFGTGYSNLAHIIGLPFDSVKIDKSLIWDAVKSYRCNVMIRELIQIFKDIDLSVTAEGIENEQQDLFVRECGCNKIQGFRYACPMCAEDVKNYFSKANHA